MTTEALRNVLANNNWSRTTSNLFIKGSLSMELQGQQAWLRRDSKQVAHFAIPEASIVDEHTIKIIPDSKKTMNLPL